MMLVGGLPNLLRRSLQQGSSKLPTASSAAATSRLLHIQPFKAFRPPTHLAQSVIAPPYDTLSSEEARQLAAGNEKSFLRVNKAEIDFPPDFDPYDEKVYQKAKTNLEDFISAGWLHQDDSPSFHVYAQRMGDHVQYGITAGVRVEDYANNLIKKHELTVKKKEDDRTKLTLIQNANVGPVFLMYRPEEAINQIVEKVTKNEPEQTAIAPDDGTEHMIWPVSDPAQVAALQEAFGPVPAAYIADGHHRSASAYNVGALKMAEARAAGVAVTGAEPFASFLAVLFPAPQLKVLEYNRVVRDLRGLAPAEFLAAAAERFEVGPPQAAGAEAARPTKKGEFAMCLDGEWRRLTARPGTFDAADPVRSLDVQVLYDNLLAPTLGIGNPRADGRIKYVGGVRGAAELERLVGGGGGAPGAAWGRVAFLLHPVSVDEVMAIADADAIMPPKATWFEPKLKSGLVVRKLDNC